VTHMDVATYMSGRDVSEIRRMRNLTGVVYCTVYRGFLQGPPEQWVEQLLPLVLEMGVSTFIVGSDDPRTIQTFGGEVAPALREAVERERATAGTRTRSEARRVGRECSPRGT